MSEAFVIGISTNLIYTDKQINVDNRYVYV